MDKSISTFIILLIILGGVVSSFKIGPVKASPETVYVDDDNVSGPWDGTLQHPYQNITSGLEHASTDDTIFVRNGTYYENVHVNKSVSLVGENRHGTIVDANFSGNAVFITVDNVNVANFTIRNAGVQVPIGNGVGVENSKNCKVSNNTITNNPLGIRIENSSNITVIDNHVFCPQDWDGIAVYSDGNTLVNNTISSGYMGILIGGCYNTLYGNKVYSNWYGIRLANSNNNTIVANEVLNNSKGIYIASYTNPGINNLIYHNNFVNNSIYQAREHNSTNIWHSGYPSGGNYWSNYNGTDLFSGPYQNETGSDGIGDTPYIVPYLNNSDLYPLMKPYVVQHDIGITSVTTSKTIVGQGYSLRVSIRSVNNGDYIENFNITVYANTTVIHTETVTLLILSFTTVTFTWNTSGVAKGNYTIRAYAWPIPGETDTADNTRYANREVCLTIPGDVDGDFDVDIFDIVKMTSIYSSKLGEPKFNPNSDIDDDSEVTILDVVICTSHYGKKYP